LRRNEGGDVGSGTTYLIKKSEDRSQNSECLKNKTTEGTKKENEEKGACSKITIIISGAEPGVCPGK